MSTEIVPLNRSDLARVDPDYEAMRTTIAVCVKVDQIAKLANMAVAAQAYCRKSLDVENEMECSRMRVQAERKVGEILKKMAANGKRSGKGDRAANVAPRDISTLADLASSATAPLAQYNSPMCRRINPTRRLQSLALRSRDDTGAVVQSHFVMLLSGRRDHARRICADALAAE